MSILFLLALPVLMYLLLIRPQQKRLRDQREMLAAVQEGDEIVTTGGIFGYVNAIEGDTIWLEIAEGTEVRIARAAVMKRTQGAATDAAHGAAGAEDASADAPSVEPSTNGSPASRATSNGLTSAGDAVADAAEDETTDAGPEAGGER